MSNKARVLYGISKVCKIWDSSASRLVPLSVQVSCSVIFRIPHVPSYTPNVINVVFVARIHLIPKSSSYFIQMQVEQIVPTLLASYLLYRLKSGMWSERIIHEYTAIYPNIHTLRVTIPSWGTVKQFYTILFAQSNDQHSPQAVKRITNTHRHLHTHIHLHTPSNSGHNWLGQRFGVFPLLLPSYHKVFRQNYLPLLPASPTWGPLYSLYTQYTLYSVCVLFAFNLYPN